MKVKVLVRNPEDYVRQSTTEINRLPRNLDPSLHPFEAQREYTRALNATKLERVFAKPFVGALEGHTDGVNALARFQRNLPHIVSGSCDGEIRIWNLTNRTCLQKIAAHTGFVRGISSDPSGENILSVGDDKVIKQWSLRSHDNSESIEPKHSILHKSLLTSIDHHWKDPVFATAGQQVDIWSEGRSTPLHSFSWGIDTLHTVRFNPIETSILGSTGSDRSIILYDIRGTSPLRKIILKMRTNAIAWNPLEAFIFTAANEDSNLYTFDMRRLDVPVNVHKDHVAAVLDVDYSPTGQEFVSGSFDKSIRIFKRDRGHSREVYHTSRMQRVFCVKFSADSTFVLSGSDETNIRLWKANASEKLGAVRPRQKAALRYNHKLQDQFKYHPEIKRIQRHRHVPKPIYKARKNTQVMEDSQKRKEENRRIHSKPGAVPHVPERTKSIVDLKK